MMANRGFNYTCKTNIRVIQLNVLSWNNIARRLWITLYLREMSPDIILLNSTSLVCTAHNKNSLTKIKLENYKTYLTRQDVQYGSAILVKKNLEHSIIPNLSDTSIAIKAQTSVGPVIFYTAYIPPRINSINPLDFQKLLSVNVPLLVAGDFNANHAYFGNKTRVPNHRGELLYNICKLHKLDFLGPDFHTFYSGKSKGKPDIILGNKLLSIFNKYVSQGPRVGSDHIPIQIELDTKPIYIKTNEPLPDYRKANWDPFKIKLMPLTPPALDKQRPTEINNAIDKLFEHIASASSEYIPLTKHKKIKQNFNSLLTIKLIKNYQSYFSDQAHPPPQGLINITRQLIFENLIIDKDVYWKKIVKTASDCYGDHNTFWKHIKQLRGHHNDEVPYILWDNKKITDKNTQTEILAETWDNTFRATPNNNANWSNINKVTNWINQNRAKISPYKLVDLRRLEENNILTSPITREEVKHYIKIMKKKAPGESKIGHQIIKQLPDNIIEYILNIFNASLACGYFPKKFKSAILKLIPKEGKDATLPQNYRPIALLDNIGKIFEKIINSRLRQFFEENNLYNYQQYGFRQWKSTTHVVNMIHECINLNSAQGYKTAILSKDVQKAFDTVWHSGLIWKIYHRFKLPMALKNYLPVSSMTDR